MDVQNWPLDRVTPYENNPRDNDDAVDATANSIKEFGWQQPIVVDKDGVIIVGHTRLKAAKQLGLDQVPVVVADNLSEEQAKAYRLADNKTGELADWDEDMLSDELADIDQLDMSNFGFDVDSIDLGQSDGGEGESEHYTLAEKYIVNPFSVLDARMGDWQDRKRAWLSLGIESEKGRDDNLSGASERTDYMNGTNTHVAPATSVFDPVLCELMYKWFNIEGGSILDPFAGGSVRGIVASKLGYDYYGNDLRQEQIDANISNAKEIGISPMPHWSCGDSARIDELIAKRGFDMVFTCPPYADLEVYSDLKEDISNMGYAGFSKTYKQIIAKSVAMLRDDRFAVVVVGEVRDKSGCYYGFVKDTIDAFESAGMSYYNEMILVTPNGTAGMRADRTFGSLRKVVKTHQNVLVFYKGNVNKIKENYNHIDVGEVS